MALKASPFGWKVGDSIVVAATTPGATQNESRQIKAISGNVVTLDRPLAYSHVAPSADFEVNVANVTRNAAVESETSVIERRGHVMFMHNPDVNIDYVGFYRLGRTDKSKPIDDPVVQSDWTLKPGTGTNPRARYAVHFHRTGTTGGSEPAMVVGNAVVDSPGWGFVNHSSNVDMIGNVAFNVNGAAFTTEVGDEIGGFYGNLAIGTTGTDEAPNAREEVQDFGFRGDGFWFQGAGVSVVGNISAGNQGDAFVYYTRGIFGGQFLASNLVDPSIAQGAAAVPIGQVPIRQFSNNFGYASGIGLRVRYHLQEATQGQTSVVDNSKFWNNTTGVLLTYAQNTTLRNVSVVTAEPQYTGIKTGLLTSDNMVFDNVSVSGYNLGIELPRRGTSLVNGGTFNNDYDIVLYTATMGDRNILITGQTGQPKIQTVFETQTMFDISGATADDFFVKDVVTLNYGQFVNQRLYGTMQAASAIPFPIPRSGVPQQYVGLTNQQLWNLYGVAIGGAIAPSSAMTVPNITGLVAPKV